MVRYLVITARNRSELHAYLRRQFSPDDLVQVLLDRRRGERRHRPQLHDPERRRGDRRSQPGKDNWLQYHGLLIVHQLLEGDWRASPSGAAVPEGVVRFSAPTRIEGAEAPEDRERVIGWIGEGQRLFSLLPKFFQEYGHLTDRAETAERKCERLEHEIRGLRNENNHFRMERRQLVNGLRALAKQMVETAGEEFP
jgi:hypothetical protein